MPPLDTGLKVLEFMIVLKTPSLPPQVRTVPGEEPIESKWTGASGSTAVHSVKPLPALATTTGGTPWARTSPGAAEKTMTITTPAATPTRIRFRMATTRPPPPPTLLHQTPATGGGRGPPIQRFHF